MLARQLWIAHLIRLVVVVLVARYLYLDAEWSMVVSVVVALTVPLLFHALVLAGQFGMASVFGSPTPERFAQTRWQSIRVYLEELWVSVFQFEVNQPVLGMLPLASAPAPGHADRLPVLFVHGFFCNRAIWRPLARDLSAQGHVTGSVNLEPVFASIDDFVPLIEAGIRDLQRRSGEEQVALVCHSMGGLAARAYLRSRGNHQIARVITLASPHRGTVHARFGTARNVVQLRRDSAWLATLSATETSEDRRLFTVIYSHHDNIIAPQALQDLPDAVTIELGGVGHMAMLYRQNVWQIIAQQLDRRTATPP